ncbi:unnamed protein product, partial [Mycena citricolor]
SPQGTASPICDASSGSRVETLSRLGEHWVPLQAVAFAVTTDPFMRRGHYWMCLGLNLPFLGPQISNISEFIRTQLWLDLDLGIF